ncbi:MAG: prolyl-tRNA synthetase [Halanaerobium sp. 4-GBenrich]|uniref:Proline--tRNA ligase n=1 Tax=Halanaerobium congolense TaxID=54121 RepID=A0A1G6I6T8_9FIRM|nr:proline--tRNA ligase [Halanaerobium congolense]KXS50293.1 MAG: prolyl-tRNA synthetase [Halanaerobium sp. T82-1]ODS50458.1 MAG: prolyl-tRNA synthetase [Halanaerobium sp. 4-GBenrich]TDP27166.1 prolyl-tRNA synthetase [Halanaerobium congolense]TDX46907.1 prolyl-tRNA synthetase [Halanaerobium congolense]SDC02214.1 prolyl-tRNA synthetase [Halanaerobium congolense]
MRMSKLYLPTLKEDPAEAEVTSHKLMLRAGLMRKHSSGIYSYLPLGYRIIKKIEKITRKHMDNSGAQEVLLPVMQTSEIWKDSKRWDKFGPLMIKFLDRKNREYCLGPTHEEVVTDLVRDEVRSYKDLPLNLYQIQTKVRDEIRPRFGVMRGREFIMKDAYSLDVDYQGLDKSYQAMYDAYERIFAECGLEAVAVEADTGAMGGKDSHEFMVLADSGEDEIAFCSHCDYAANVERATSDKVEIDFEVDSNFEKIHTPEIKTIDQLVEYLEVPAAKMIKAVALVADGEAVLALVSGEDELNEIKLINYLQANELRAAEEEEFEELFNSVPGFIGPVNLDEVRVVADKRLQNMSGAVVGANEIDYHFKDVKAGRDFEVEAFTDLRSVKEGENCSKCESGKLNIKDGIEVGHIFKLGTKYSENMGANYLDENGKAQPIVMGSYGIGITRLVAAAIEQNNDQYGIKWPKAIAPYQVIILPLGNDRLVQEKSEEIYQSLKDQGWEVLIDDRQERAGVKFNDSELIGIPLRLTIGSRSLENGVVEAMIRSTNEKLEIKLDNLEAKVKELFAEIS